VTGGMGVDAAPANNRSLKGRVVRHNGDWCIKPVSERGDRGLANADFALKQNLPA